MNFNEKLNGYIRSTYPSLYIVTSEEQRCESDIRYIIEKEFAGDEDQPVIYSWALTKGLFREYPGKEWIKTHSEDEETGPHDPAAVLDYFYAQKGEGDYILILNDYHHYIKDPYILRRLKDLFKEFKEKGAMIIFLSPVLEVPADIEREVVIEEFDLPDKKVLSERLDVILDAVAGDLSIVMDEEKRNSVLDAALGMTTGEAENVFARSIIECEDLNIKTIIEHKAQVIKKTGSLEWIDSNVNMDTGVGGLDVLKNWIRKRSKAFTKQAKEFGLPMPRGAMLAGIPGCGKSMAAKATADLWSIPLLRCDIGSIFGSLVGESEANLRKVLAIVDRVAPCVLWLDEIEKGFAGAGGSGNLDGGTSKRVFGSFLTWMQERTTPVFVFATANDIKSLPPEFLRKGGRFDEIFFIGLPNKVEREAIWKIHLSKVNTYKEEDFDFVGLSALTEFFSGAEITSIIDSALFDAFDEDESLEMKHLIDVAKNTVPLSKTMGEELGRLREWGKSHAKLASTPDKSGKGVKITKKRKIRHKKSVEKN